MKEKIENLVRKLNEARDAYYLNDTEIMSNKEYDALFDELVALEAETGIILPNSPTQTVGATNMEKGVSLEKVTHEYPALSLDKVKVTEESFEKDLLKFMGNNKCFLSFKLDGLTIVATYDNGKLTRAVTRGNGIIGEDVTENAKYFKGLPQEIPYKEHLVVRGEALITYSEFNRINSMIEDANSKYKNPRNLASSTVRALDSNICKDRHVNFCLFEAVTIFKYNNSKLAVLSGLEEIGFDVVKRIPVNANTIIGAIESLTNEAKLSDLPTDGLVLTYDNITLSESVGSTGHHSRAGLAIKWGDETAETTLRKIEWSLGRTGVLTPVAIFDTVELEGTEVSRASLHNISYIMEKDLRVGDVITIYKANMIIPQVDRNITGEERNCQVKGTHLYNLPSKCPCCGEATGIHGMDEDVMTLHCNNPFCGAKNIGAITHMAERDCLNIVGFSEERVTFLIENGYIKNRFDVFTLPERMAASLDGTKLLNTELGWGEKAVNNLIEAINNAKKCDFVSFIHAMGIPNIGKGQAKLIKKYLDTNYDKLVSEYKQTSTDKYDLIGLLINMECAYFDWSVIEGIGQVLANSLSQWIRKYLINPVVNPSTLKINDTTPSWEVLNLLKKLNFTDEKPAAKSTGGISLDGKTFVITGDVHIFKNRAELQAKIEELGGKASGSVSAKTTYLINNDVNSTSGKNKKAKELGIPIISEEDFLKIIS